MSATMRIAHEPVNISKNILRSLMSLIQSQMAIFNASDIVCLTTKLPQWSMEHHGVEDFFTVLGLGDYSGLGRKRNVAMYRDILDENLLQSAQDLRLGQRFTFQQDNNQKHNTMKELLQYNSVNAHWWLDVCHYESSPGFRPPLSMILHHISGI